jgi:uridine phosphorylase
MSTDDFYEEQGRLDGAICEHSLEDKMEFLKNLSGLGVKNIEMEAGYFAAFTHHLGIKAGVICVALINRLEGDTVRSKKKDLVEFEKFPIQVLLGYIKKHHIK